MLVLRQGCQEVPRVHAPEDIYHVFLRSNQQVVCSASWSGYLVAKEAHQPGISFDRYGWALSSTPGGGLLLYASLRRKSDKSNKSNKSATGACYPEIAKGQFPKQVKLTGARSVGRHENAIKSWLESRPNC